MEPNQETHALFGNRSAYEAKHALKRKTEEIRQSEKGELYGIHNEILRKAQEKAREFHVQTQGLNNRLIELGKTWVDLMGSSGNELNAKINEYIDQWAEIDRVFQNLESQQGDRPVENEGGENNEVQQLLSSFEKFVSQHSDLIARELKAGKDLAGVFYDNFYTEDIDRQLYKKGDPKYEAMRRAYEPEARRVLDKFLTLSEKYKKDAVPPISPGRNSIDNGWVYFKLNGGANPKEKRGRLYLNIQPENLAQFYENSLPVLQRGGLRVDAKISQNANPEDVNRYDKMVIYFNEADEAAMMSAMEQLYSQSPQIFMEGSPKFTVPLADSRGESMAGVSFGEEPGKAQRGQSFGDIRSKILADIYTSVQKDGYSVSEGRAQNDFQTACRKYGVDEDNPAFNTDQGFGMIKNQGR